MKKLLTFFCLILLSPHSYSQDVFTGPFLERDGITYHQDTNELVTGIVESFYENGQLRSGGRFIDGKRHGQWNSFDEDGTSRRAKRYKYGEVDDTLEKILERRSVD